jgi:hypothetical protein
MTDDRTNPEHLRMLLFGGSSKGAGRSYTGLAAQVQERITQLYRVPRPAGEPTGSIIGGGRSGGAIHDESDPTSLRDYLVDWLNDRRLTTSQISEEDMHNLVSRANARAGRMLKRSHVPEGQRLKILNLAMTYLVWLRKACDHKHARRTAGALDCPDCGAVEVDVR